MHGDNELFDEGWLNGHDVCRDEDDGGIWYDGYYCADATDYEEETNLIHYTWSFEVA